MTPEERQAQLRLRAFRDFLPELRGAIDDVEATITRFITGIDEGRSIQELVVDATERRSSLRPSEAVVEYQRMHKEARLALFAVAFSEGMSKADIGRAWGISRQLSSVYVDEALERFGHPTVK